MASADLRQELVCSLCLSIYTDPVTLTCGHNFCHVCIGLVLDTQKIWSEAYTCPDCRAEYLERPILTWSTTLCNIVGRFLSTQTNQKETGICCTYCLDSPVPATKSCLSCEAHLCDNHLRVHSKSEEHVLSDPATSLGKRKCSIHKKNLDYYCTKDSACICVSCIVAREHRGHQVQTLDAASEKKKEKLRDVLQKLTTKRKEAEKRVQSLQKRRRDQRKAVRVSETVTDLFRDIRKQLEDLEKKAHSEISRQEQRVSLSVSDLIQQLEIKKDELSRKMRHIEQLCNLFDPVTVLQQPDIGDLSDTEVTERHDNQVHGVGDLDVGLISELNKLSDIITGIYNTYQTVTPKNSEQNKPCLKFTQTQPQSAQTMPRIAQKHKLSGKPLKSTNSDRSVIIGSGVRYDTGVYVQEPADISLDVTTAGDYIQISDDMKTASWSYKKQKHPETPERFQINQVISTREFSSGQHYWDVDVSKSQSWRVGMCYPSIGRRGRQSVIGSNNKSWGLDRRKNQYSVIHDSKVIHLSENIPCNRVRICLDYEAGQLSFYSLCDPIKLLHTYTAAFTEPLYAALCVWQGCIEISGGVRILKK